MKVLVRSYGCSTNKADGSVLAGCLVEAGYEVADSVLHADVVVYNTCAVKGPTENRMIDLCRKIPRDKKLVVAGCLPAINLERLEKEVACDGIIGPAAGQRIVEIVRLVLDGKKVRSPEANLKNKPQLFLPRTDPSSVISLVPISYGCLGACAYCCVKLARGGLRSLSIEQITNRMKADVAIGFQEFWLTGQDTACYGMDVGTSLPELLKSVCAIDGEFKIRVGMMNPHIAIQMLDALANSFANHKIFKFLHLPVQSGDNRILKEMHRFYNIKDFKNITRTFRARNPKCTIATDVICGFPGETEEDFEHTMQLIQEVKPDVTNVSKFFPRPGTLAATMHKDAVSLREIKRRSTVAATLAREVTFERNQRWVGWEGFVLIDEIGKIPDTWIGRNFAYKPIVVKNAGQLLGKTLKVCVVEAHPTYLEGKILDLE